MATWRSSAATSAPSVPAARWRWDSGVPTVAGSSSGGRAGLSRRVTGARGLALGAMAMACLQGSPAAAQTAQALAAIDRYVRDEVRRQRIPAVSVAILRHGRVILSRGYGYANLEHRARATDSTV